MKILVKLQHAYGEEYDADTWHIQGEYLEIVKGKRVIGCHAKGEWEYVRYISSRKDKEQDNG